MTTQTQIAPDSAAARERLRELIVELAVVRGRVTLASGMEADYYIDLRRVTLQHEASRLVGQVMLELLDDAGWTERDDDDVDVGREMTAEVLHRTGRAGGPCSVTHEHV